MLSTKNNNNNSSVYANIGTFDNIYNKSEVDLLFGSSSTDLSNYYNKYEVDSKVGGVYNILANEYYSQVEADSYFYKKDEVYTKAYINSVVNTLSGTVSTISGTVNNLTSKITVDSNGVSITGNGFYFNGKKTFNQSTQNTICTSLLIDQFN